MVDVSGVAQMNEMFFFRYRHVIDKMKEWIIGKELTVCKSLFGVT